MSRSLHSLPIALALALAACGPQPLTVTREPVVLDIVASDSCGPLMEELALAYEEGHPWVTVQVTTFNTATAEARLRAGAADLAALSSPHNHPTPLWSVPFATDGVAIVVHPAVPVTGLGLLQLQEIFRGRIGAWEDGTPIQVVSREEGAGTRAVFETTVMDDHDVTLTSVVMPGDQQVLDYVANTPGAIGYVSLGWAASGVRVLAVEGLPPTPDNLDGYPLSYPLLLSTTSEPTGEVREFIQWVLGPEGQQRVQQRFAPPGGSDLLENSRSPSSTTCNTSLTSGQCKSLELCYNVGGYAFSGIEDVGKGSMSRGTILYIEDNPENRLLVRRVLEAEGYTVLEAEDGPTGLEVARSSPVDLILLDINLPEIDGYQLVSHLRTTPGLADKPIIALTANVMKGDRERTLEAGCDGYIQKPIDVDSLPEQVATFLRQI